MTTRTSATVDLLLRHGEAVSVNTPCLEVLDLFIAQPELYAIVVLADNRVPAGLVDRQSLIETFIRPYARELHAKKSIRPFMVADPVMVEGSTAIDDLARIIIDAGMKQLVSGFIITHDGVYVGMGTGHGRGVRRTPRARAASGAASVPH